MPLRDYLQEAAIWHEGWCLSCQVSWDQGEQGAECPLCGGPATDAGQLFSFLLEVERETEAGSEGESP